MYMPYKYVIIVRTQKQVEKRCCSFRLGTIIPYLYCIYIYIWVDLGTHATSMIIYIFFIAQIDRSQVWNVQHISLNSIRATLFSLK